MGSERDTVIANMESMGFERSRIDQAMRAAFFNPERAIEYLFDVRHSRCLKNMGANSNHREFQKTSRVTTNLPLLQQTHKQQTPRRQLWPKLLLFQQPRIHKVKSQ